MKTKKLVPGQMITIEEELHEQLINFLLVIAALSCLILFFLSLIQAIKLNFNLRYIANLGFHIFMIIIALLRRKIPLHIKINILIYPLLLISSLGIYANGMLAANAIITPLALVLSALFRPLKTVILLSLSSLGFISYVAFGFISKTLKSDLTPSYLMTNPTHWALYLILLTSFIFVSCLAIFKYRQVVGTMLDDIKSKHGELASKNQELRGALNKIKTLKGLIPICSYCKQIRNDKGTWDQLEAYLHSHSDVEFTHGICPDCYDKQLAEEIR